VFASRVVSLLASPTKIRLGWKGLPGTNTIAYLEHPYFVNVKWFITLAPDFAGKATTILTWCYDDPLNFQANFSNLTLEWSSVVAPFMFAQELIETISLCWKWTGTISLSYRTPEVITTVKSFVVPASDVNL